MEKRKNAQKAIILTGGGTAGHVIPNLTLLPQLLADNWDVHYIGSKTGIESSLIQAAGIPYHAISTGKLRRYFDIKNFSDPFKVIGGVAEANRLISKIKPAVVFSKGGFVSVPVVCAAFMHRVPSVLHESDITPGLANKICMPFSEKICTSFQKTLSFVPPKKALYTGTPVRPELLNGDKSEGYRICGFHEKKPVLLVTGGSLGSANLNRHIRSVLPQLSQSFQIIHICGNGNIDQTLLETPEYRQFEYADTELPHLMKMSDIAVSRAGSNTIFEFLAMQLPALLIPIPKSASRGDQLLNASEFEKSGFCMKLEEEEITSGEVLPQAIRTLYKERDKFRSAMASDEVPDAKNLILQTIYSVARPKS